MGRRRKRGGSAGIGGTIGDYTVIAGVAWSSQKHDSREEMVISPIRSPSL